MKTKAAVVYEPGKPIEIEELDLDGPREGEVLIRYTHAGLCHSDVHVAHGDLEARLPMVLGHEGAGIIEEVGPGVTRVKPGDHVVCSFIPNCGICRYCATGRQSICDWGATLMEGVLPGGRFPITGPRGQYGAFCLIGTFSQYGVIHQNSAVKIDDDLPMVLGHEGAGIVEEVGPGVTRVAPGDHVVCSFIPNCGYCRYCATGRQSICDMGATILEGYLPGGKFPLRGPRGDYGTMCMLGTFSQYGLIHQNSAVKVDDGLPLEKAVLVGCGVPTGWGSAVNTANVYPGDTVVIYGIGGIGINAVQGAKYAGAKYVVAVDPLENKRAKALELGATHAFATAAEAQDKVTDLTRGQLADSAIITVGLVDAEVVGNAFNVIGKGGTVVVTGLNNFDVNIQLPATILTLFRKTIKGSLFGDCNPTTDIPKILGLYQSGDLKLDEIITRTYTLDQVNEGYDDLLNGENIRGVIIHEH